MECELARDRVLMAIDSFLFEFRAFLDLLAQFAYRFLIDTGKRPASSQMLTFGKAIDCGPEKEVAASCFLAVPGGCARSVKRLVSVPKRSSYRRQHESHV
jgi:hypothetical protein